MQAVDYTTLFALCGELQGDWLPARIEQIYQRDRHTLSLSLRTLSGRGWLTLCWHPQAARLCLDPPPPREPDTFTLSEQLRHQIKGLALSRLELVQPWERVVDLAIAKRPGEEPQYHLFLEVMGKYSNLVLTDAQQQIITVAHQVNANQSRVRTVLTGQPYQPPPLLLANTPKTSESFADWRDQVNLIPGAIGKQLLKSYRGVSPQVIQFLLTQANVEADQENWTLTGLFARLFDAWQQWLNSVEHAQFQPAFTTRGFTVLGSSSPDGSAWESVNDMISHYFSGQQTRAQFQQLHHQLRQRVKSLVRKSQQKVQTFEQRLVEAENNQQYQTYGDLLMANMPLAQPGLSEVTVRDFEQGTPLTIPLKADKTWIQNAQWYYKQQQKLNRARGVVVPLLEQAQAELAYLVQVEASLDNLPQYQEGEDWLALSEIRDELREQGYLKTDMARQRRRPEQDFKPHIRTSPSGFPIWIGRNNRQNDQLSFRIATDYDLLVPKSGNCRQPRLIATSSGGDRR